MEKIKSYEEALNVLGIEKPAYLDDMPKNEQAYHKLCTISEALNWGHKKEDMIWFPWWFKNDLQDGFEARHLDVGLAFKYAFSPVGFRLCSFDENTALYFGSEPFIKLWQDHLL